MLGYDGLTDSVTRSGLQPYFEQISTSAAVVSQTSSGIFGFHGQLPCHPFQVLMIGDTLGADILGAFNAGLPASGSGAGQYHR